MHPLSAFRAWHLPAFQERRLMCFTSDGGAEKRSHKSSKEEQQKKKTESARENSDVSLRKSSGSKVEKISKYLKEHPSSESELKKQEKQNATPVLAGAASIAVVALTLDDVPNMDLPDHIRTVLRTRMERMPGNVQSAALSILSEINAADDAVRISGAQFLLEANPNEILFLAQADSAERLKILGARNPRVSCGMAMQVQRANAAAPVAPNASATSPRQVLTGRLDALGRVDQNMMKEIRWKTTLLKRQLDIGPLTSNAVARQRLLANITRDRSSLTAVFDDGVLSFNNGNTRYYYAVQLGIPDSEIPVSFDGERMTMAECRTRVLERRIAPTVPDRFRSLPQNVRRPLFTAIDRMDDAVRTRATTLLEQAPPDEILFFSQMDDGLRTNILRVQNPTHGRSLLQLAQHSEAFRSGMAQLDPRALTQLASRAGRYGNVFATLRGMQLSSAEANNILLFLSNTDADRTTVRSIVRALRQADGVTDTSVRASILRRAARPGLRTRLARMGGGAARGAVRLLPAGFVALEILSGVERFEQIEDLAKRREQCRKQMESELEVAFASGYTRSGNVYTHNGTGARFDVTRLRGMSDDLLNQVVTDRHYEATRVLGSLATMTIATSSAVATSILSGGALIVLGAGVHFASEVREGGRRTGLRNLYANTPRSILALVDPQALTSQGYGNLYENLSNTWMNTEQNAIGVGESAQAMRERSLDNLAVVLFSRHIGDLVHEQGLPSTILVPGGNIDLYLYNERTYLRGRLRDRANSLRINEKDRANSEASMRTEMRDMAQDVLFRMARIALARRYARLRLHESGEQALEPQALLILHTQISLLEQHYTGGEHAAGDLHLLENFRLDSEAEGGNPMFREGLQDQEIFLVEQPDDPWSTPVETELHNIIEELGGARVRTHMVPGGRRVECTAGEPGVLCVRVGEGNAAVFFAVLSGHTVFSTARQAAWRPIAEWQAFVRSGPVPPISKVARSARRRILQHLLPPPPVQHRSPAECKQAEGTIQGLYKRISMQDVRPVRITIEGQPGYRLTAQNPNGKGTSTLEWISRNGQSFWRIGHSEERVGQWWDARYHLVSGYPVEFNAIIRFLARVNAARNHSELRTVTEPLAKKQSIGADFLDGLVNPGLAFEVWKEKFEIDNKNAQKGHAGVRPPSVFSTYRGNVASSPKVAGSADRAGKMAKLTPSLVGNVTLDSESGIYSFGTVMQMRFFADEWQWRVPSLRSVFTWTPWRISSDTRIRDLPSAHQVVLRQLEQESR